MWKDSLMHLCVFCFCAFFLLLIRVRAAVAADPTDYSSAAEAVQKGALLLGPLLPMGTFEGGDARAELSERCRFFCL